MELDLTRQQMPVARQAYSMTLTVKKTRSNRLGWSGGCVSWIYRSSLQAENDLKFARLDLELARQRGC
jgi:hypothetical protein